MRAVNTSPESASSRAKSSAKISSHPVPVPEQNMALVRVAASGVNRADLLQIAGKYPPPAGATDILGLECSGLIESAHSVESPFHLGQKVVALLDSGGYAEFAQVPFSLLLPMPRMWSLVQAGGLMEAACTTWSNLTDIGKLAPGETVLIHGGSGGVGTFAIQYAKALGATVIATARTSQRADRCSELGADHVIAYGEYEDFAAELPYIINDLTNRAGADVILDVLGGEYLNSHIASLAIGGRLITIGLQRGASGNTNLGALMAKRASIHGTTLRSRPLHEKAAIVRGVHLDIWPLLENHQIKPVLEASYPLEEFHTAHEHLASGEVFGKIVLVP